MAGHGKVSVGAWVGIGMTAGAAFVSPSRISRSVWTSVPQSVSPWATFCVGGRVASEFCPPNIKLHRPRSAQLHLPLSSGRTSEGQLDLYRIDLAGVVSKYIGETEKNLRRVFDAAQRSGRTRLDRARALDRVQTARRTVKCASWWILPQSPKFFSKTVGTPSLEAPSTSATTPAPRRPRARQRRLDSRLKRKTAPPSSDRSRPSWRYGEHQRGTNARRANEVVRAAAADGFLSTPVERDWRGASWRHRAAKRRARVARSRARFPRPHTRRTAASAFR